MMNEVKEAWSSLVLSSRGSMTTSADKTAPTTAKPSYSNCYSLNNRLVCIGNSRNSSTTWYDVPSPEIIHNREFSEEPSVITTSNNKTATIPIKKSFKNDNENLSGDAAETMRKESFLSTEEMSINQRLSKNFVCDAVESARSQNDRMVYENDRKAGSKEFIESCAEKIVENNLELRRNVTVDVKEAVPLNYGDRDNEDKEEKSKLEDDIVVVVGRRKKNDNELGKIKRRQHTSSVEMQTTVTSAETGKDGIPTITFNFLRAEKLKNSLGSNFEEKKKCHEISDDFIDEQLYDFPKNRRINERKMVENLENNVDKEKTNYFNETRFMGDGSFDCEIKNTEGEIYDFPKRTERIQETFNFVARAHFSVSSKNEEEEIEEGESYESSLRQTKDSSCSTFKQDDTEVDSNRLKIEAEAVGKVPPANTHQCEASLDESKRKQAAAADFYSRRNEDEKTDKTVLKQFTKSEEQPYSNPEYQNENTVDRSKDSNEILDNGKKTFDSRRTEESYDESSVRKVQGESRKNYEQFYSDSEYQNGNFVDRSKDSNEILDNGKKTFDSRRTEESYDESSVRKVQGGSRKNYEQLYSNPEYQNENPTDRSKDSNEILDNGKKTFDSRRVEENDEENQVIKVQSGSRKSYDQLYLDPEYENENPADRSKDSYEKSNNDKKSVDSRRTEESYDKSQAIKVQSESRKSYEQLYLDPEYQNENLADRSKDSYEISDKNGKKTLDSRRIEESDDESDTKAIKVQSGWRKSDEQLYSNPEYQNGNPTNRSKDSNEKSSNGKKSFDSRRTEESDDESDTKAIKVESGSRKSEEQLYSDPEFSPQDPDSFVDAKIERSKSRKHHHYHRSGKRRLGKAWGRVRSWLQEEKSRIGKVVNRHAKMQAVGALNNDKFEKSSSLLGGRTGCRSSYDLTTCTTQNSTRDLAFRNKAVSEQDFNFFPSKRVTKSGFYQVNSEENDEISSKMQNDATNESANSEDGCVGTVGIFREKTSEHFDRQDKIKLTPVSMSLDKLCDEEVNEEVGREDTGAAAAAAAVAQLPRENLGKSSGRLIKRRMLGSIRGLMASTHLIVHQNELEEGGSGGFEDVRRYVKQGGDFCKELAAILHERAELEANYAKGLGKLSGKLTKACTKEQGGNSSGGVTEAWRSIGDEMEAAAEAHRAWGIALSEQLAKPLRIGVAEAQGRSRKVIESSVDKASKSLQEWRGIAAKSKKQSFACARENERLQDLARIQSITQSQQQNNNNKNSSSSSSTSSTSHHHHHHHHHHHQMTEKEANKLESRRRKAEDSSRRADTEFYTVSVRAERARLEYESTVRKGAKQMELLEEERLSALKDLANVYLAHLQALAPRLQQSADRLSSPVRGCSVSQDVEILRNVIRRLDSSDGSNVDQLLLPDFYAEHVTLAMNRERRKQALVRVLHLIRQDLERERRGREGLETLHRAFIQTPAFAADESTQNVTEKLHHMRSMLTFLEAARYKVGGTLAEVEGGKRGKHPLAEHILVSRDKQGLQQSVLKVPSWAKNESFEFPEGQDELELNISKDHESERREWVDRTAGDGNSENPPDEEDFSDFDEFSSQSEDNNNQEVEINDITDKVERIEQCRAIYQYSANLNDELTLTPGDLITIHEKQADGWWIGECAGRTGIFPATYVQVIR